MLPWLRDDRPVPKCIYTRAAIPSYVDPAQPPQKRKPFSSVHKLNWAHTVDISLPEESLNSFQHEISKLDSLKYAKVILKLGDLLDGDFFNEYIKKGNILMLSEGRPGVDNMFELREGHLHLSLDHATYERVGLQGQAIFDGGLKHKKSRFAIDIDLRKPSMLHGKKGFERVVWAAKNVLNSSMTWLFIDRANTSIPPATAVNGEGNGLQMPIDAHHPRWFRISVCESTISNVFAPNITLMTQSSTDTHPSALEDDDFIAAFDEWLSLLSLDSSLLQSSSPKPDPYICRYSPPEFISNEAEGTQIQETNIARLRWQGFISSEAILAILIASLKIMSPGRQMKTHESGKWLALQAHGFRGQNLTLYLTETQHGSECLEWSYGTPES